mmetsp:Transcript_43485/g.106388  ORF Transcript_43485/g.106388 Transcript_43485/m.106388 type:complete len:248 (+) Transcript_43485:160-903(+)
MSRVEYVDLCGLRVDGRRPNELRKINGKLSVLTQPDGSAIFEQGNTKVLAAIFGPRECTLKSKELHDRAHVTVEVSLVPFATGERKKRGRGDRQVLELQSMIKETVCSLIFTNQFPRSQIDIVVEVLQSDGSLRSATINAVTLALIDAGLPMHDFLCACTVGYVDGYAIVDVNYIEDLAKGPELCIAYMPNQDKIITTQLEPKLPLEALSQVLDLALESCRQVYKTLQAMVMDHACTLAAARGSVST